MIDGSKSEIPNTPESKEWANIKENSLTNRKASRTLFSTIIDAKYGIVLDSIFGKSDSSERELAKQHIKNIESLVNFKDLILIFDAGYYSLELKLFLEKMSINYIFRLAPNVYEKEISQMTGRDEILQISNISSRRKAIKDEHLLEVAKKLPYIKARIVKIPIVNYDRLKNKMELENYSGKLEISISQDFYSRIYVFNLAMILRNDIQKKLEQKNKKKREGEDKEYRTNFNALIGRVKNRILVLFTSSKNKNKKILEKIIARGTKDTYLHDFNRPKIQWHDKLFIGKFRFNQRRNI